MKFLKNKNITSKIVIILVVMLLFQFCMPKASIAVDGVALGGKLLDPILDLFVGLGDGIMTFIQKVVFGIDDSIINIDTSTSVIAKILVVLIAAAIAILAVIFVPGGGVALAVALIKIVGVAIITFPLTTTIVEGMLPQSFYLPLYSVTPEEMFSNEIPLLDVNFFNPMDSKTLDNGTTMESTAAQLKETVSSWYNILRDIALVGSLSVLVYIGIRILISSGAKDKSKYKQMLIDWIVAICLLFIMQFIMSFSNTVVEKITDVIDTARIDANEQVPEGQEPEVERPEVFYITDEDVLKEAYKVLVLNPIDNGEISSIQESPYYSYFTQGTIENGEVTALGSPTGNERGLNGCNILTWPANNFMQQARFNLQLLSDDSETFVSIGWKLIYILLVFYTVIFLFAYLKRLAYMTFLTVIAPLVALTYPIDKINDGKAQAFDTWLKEYIFNLLLQPMHLILYMILIGSAMSFASKNVVYVVVALGFMTEAEQILRRFFGFEKAKTPGLLAGPAGAALMMQGMNKLLGKGSKGDGTKGGSSKGDDSDDIGKPPRTDPSFDKQDAMLSGGEEEKPLLEEGVDDPAEDMSNFTDDERIIGNDSTMKDKPLTAEDDPSLEDPNYMYMHSDEYDPSTGEWLPPKWQEQERERRQREQEQKDNKEQEKIKQNLDKKQEKKKIRMPRRVLRGIGGTARHYVGKTGRAFKNNKAAIAGSVLKTGANMAGGLVTGTAGALAGIASGDLNKFAQYTTAGAVAGYSGMKNLTKGLKPTNELTDTWKSNYYENDEEREKAEQAKYIKNYQNNEKIIAELEKSYGVREARKIREEVIPDYLNKGVSDIEDIKAGYEMEKQGKVKNRNEAISTAKYASRIGADTTKMKAKDRKEWQETFASEFSGNERVKNDKNLNPNSLAVKVMKNLDDFNKIKN